MARSFVIVFLTIVSIATARVALAQDVGVGGVPGRAEVTVIPGGATFFNEAKDTGAPSFGSYDLGGAFTANVNRYVGVEGEVSGQLGVSQQLGNFGADTKTPTMLNYSGNLVVYAPNRSSVVPYATGGIGGLMLFEKASLGITQNETFLTGNVGGGVKWYSGRWGLRGDYRFVTVRSKDDAPAFFGQETRYGHRIYGAVIFNVVP